ncbi:hypothetical protein, partial [Rhizobium leguminosarum]|uniref:hypothetical protein n=1 Tax=Rhizobium leguminosarum TaxID=384 RepID=UPI003F9453CB
SEPFRTENQISENLTDPLKNPENTDVSSGLMQATDAWTDASIVWSRANRTPADPQTGTSTCTELLPPSP